MFTVIGSEIVTAPPKVTTALKKLTYNASYCLIIECFMNRIRFNS